MAKASDLRRWAGWLVLVISFSVACALLSNWQFNRRQEALAAMAQVAQNYDSKPLAIDEVASINSFDSNKHEWQPVKLSGHYLVHNAVLVRNRPLDGNPGFLELVPFQLNDGRVIAIERGWLASDDHYSAPKVLPLPSEQSQAIVARVRPSEPTLDRSAPKGQLGTINIQALIESQSIKERTFTAVYARVASEGIPQTSNPKALPKPKLDEGNHLSYALQWIMFALMAVAALYWGIKKEREAVSGRKSASRKRIGERDAEVEDSLLE